MSHPRPTIILFALVAVVNLMIVDRSWADSVGNGPRIPTVLAHPVPLALSTQPDPLTLNPTVPPNFLDMYRAGNSVNLNNNWFRPLPQREIDNPFNASVVINTNSIMVRRPVLEALSLSNLDPITIDEIISRNHNLSTSADEARLSIPTQSAQLLERIRSSRELTDHFSSCTRTTQDVINLQEQLGGSNVVDFFSLCSFDDGFGLSPDEQSLAFEPTKLCECVNKKLQEQERYNFPLYNPLSSLDEQRARTREIASQVFESTGQGIQDLMSNLQRKLYLANESTEFLPVLYHMPDSSRDYSRGPPVDRLQRIEDVVKCFDTNLYDYISKLTQSDATPHGAVCTEDSLKETMKMINPAVYDSSKSLEQSIIDVLSQASAAHQEDVRYIESVIERDPRRSERADGDPLAIALAETDTLFGNDRRQRPGTPDVPYRFHSHVSAPEPFGTSQVRREYANSYNERRRNARDVLMRERRMRVIHELNLVFEFMRNHNGAIPTQQQFEMGNLGDVDALRDYFATNIFVQEYIGQFHPNENLDFSGMTWDELSEKMKPFFNTAFEVRSAILNEVAARGDDIDAHRANASFQTMMELATRVGPSLYNQCQQVVESVASLCRGIELVNSGPNAPVLTPIVSDETLLASLVGGTSRAESGQERDNPAGVHQLITDSSVILCRERTQGIQLNEEDPENPYRDPVREAFVAANQVISGAAELAAAIAEDGGASFGNFSEAILAATELAKEDNTSRCVGSHCDRLDEYRQNDWDVLSIAAPRAIPVAESSRMVSAQAQTVEALDMSSVDQSRDRPSVEAAQLRPTGGDQPAPSFDTSFARQQNALRSPASTNPDEAPQGGQDLSAEELEERILRARFDELDRRERELTASIAQKQEEIQGQRELESLREIQAELEELRHSKRELERSLARFERERQQERERTQQARTQAGEIADTFSRFSATPVRSGPSNEDRAVAAGGSAVNAPASAAGQFDSRGAGNRAGLSPMRSAGPSGASAGAARGEAGVGSAGGLVLQQDRIRPQGSSLTDLALSAVGAVAFREGRTPGTIERVVFRTENGQIVFDENGYPIVEFREEIPRDQLELLADGPEDRSGAGRAPASFDLAEILEFEQSIRDRRIHRNLIDKLQELED
jgi:hypothetical protein